MAIEIVDFLTKKCDLNHSYVTNYQRLYVLPSLYLTRCPSCRWFKYPYCESHVCFDCIVGWWYSYPIEKIYDSLGTIVPTKWNNINVIKCQVPNHQPALLLLKLHLQWVQNGSNPTSLILGSPCLLAVSKNDDPCRRT